jgi:hypothetical protein
VRSTFRILILALLAPFAVSCRHPAKSVPVATAYSDGFEVVVFDTQNGSPTNVRSLKLKATEAAIAAGSQAMLPKDVVPIEMQLIAGQSGDSHAWVNVIPLAGGKQQVHVEFHDSVRTYVYEYVVDGTKITPVESEYRDLAKSEEVRYAAK